MKLRWQSAGRTETGHLRRHNEDAILVREDLGLWAVADGLGGHRAGDEASRLIVKRLGQLSRSGDVLDFVEEVEDAVTQVNAELRELRDDRGLHLIGSTVVILIADVTLILCAWLGDSRAYCFQNNRLTRLTQDHSEQPQAIINFQCTSKSVPEMSTAVLTRAVGAEDKLCLDWTVLRNCDGARYLLCSDGVNKEMSDAELGEVFRSYGSAQEILDAIFGVTLSRRARDNISAVVVTVGE